MEQTLKPNQQLNQTSIDEQKRQKSKRIKIGLLALVAVVLTVSGVWLLKTTEPAPVVQTPPSNEQSTTNNQQSTIDTSTWQTYRNDEFGLEVRYPSGREFTDEPEFNGRIVRVEPFFDKGTNLKDKFFDISMRKIGDKECLSPVHSTKQKEAEPITISDIKFIKETVVDKFTTRLFQTISFSTIHNKNCISLIFGLNYDPYDPSVHIKEFDREKEMVVFDQILSTFRFVE